MEHSYQKFRQQVLNPYWADNWRDWWWLNPENSRTKYSIGAFVLKQEGASTGLFNLSWLLMPIDTPNHSPDKLMFAAMQIAVQAACALAQDKVLKKTLAEHACLATLQEFGQLVSKSDYHNRKYLQSLVAKKLVKDHT